jgi:hypothetical protein
MLSLLSRLLSLLYRIGVTRCMLALAGLVFIAFSAYPIPKVEDFYKTTIIYSDCYEEVYRRNSGNLVLLTSEGEYRMAGTRIKDYSIKEAIALLKRSTQAEIWVMEPGDRWFVALKTDFINLSPARAIEYEEREKLALFFLALLIALMALLWHVFVDQFYKN